MALLPRSAADERDHFNDDQDRDLVEQHADHKKRTDDLCCQSWLSHRCWINTYCCCCAISSRCQFVWYTMINITRLSLIAAMIFWASMHHEQDNNRTLQPDCCNCYQLVKHVQANCTSHDNSYDCKHDRFDFSMCIPNCVDCAFCDHQIGKGYSNLTCPAQSVHGSKYAPKTKWFHWTWYKDTGCHAQKKHMSLVELFFFSKSYRSYRILSTAVLGTYIVLLLIFSLSVLKCSNGLDSEFSRSVLFFNVLLSPVCLYFIWKPYEYHAESFTLDGESIRCSQMAITTNTRFAITIILGCVLGLTVLYMFMEIGNLCRWCRSQRKRHVNGHENSDLFDGRKPYNLKDSPHFRWNRIKTWFGCVFCCVICAFFGILIWSIAEVTYSFGGFSDIMHAKEQRERRLVVLYSSAALSVCLLGDFLFVGTPRKLVRDYCVQTQREWQRCCTCCRKKNR